MFNVEEQKLLNAIQNAMNSIESYESQLQRQTTEINKLKDSLSSWEAAAASSRLNMGVYEEDLRKYREKLRTLLSPPTVIELETKGGASNLKEDTLDGLEARSSHAS